MTRTGQHQRCISAIHWLEASGALALGAIFVTAVIGTPAAQAQTYTVVHRFKGPPTDGAGPKGHVIGDSAGNLYGTTCCGGASDAGVVFKLNQTGETVLYSFTGGTDGRSPDAGLIRDSAGNLYGTTSGGGASDKGVVFKLDTTGTETVLHRFTGADGSGPQAGLIRDSAGNFYGTTVRGGRSGCGVVFKLDTTGSYAVLYSFKGYPTDGLNPYAGLIADSAGNLYGTTNQGGAFNAGVVFKLDTSGTETVLYTFTGGADGANPTAGLIQGSAGNLYGTTGYGGASGAGVVFKLDTSGTETVLYTFTGGADGGNPYAGLIRDSAGNLYGTTEYGGTARGGLCFTGGGCGVVFELDTTGTETVLYSFTGGADGSNPEASLIRNSAGNLYGTASGGGISGNGAGNGVVFRIQP
jgi:uncharacterized repeat protein (TIGR03803 family)